MISLANNVLGQANNYPPSGNVGLGVNPASYKLDIVSTAVSGIEKVLRLSVTDSPNDYLEFSNATSLGNIFIPSIKAYYTGDNRSAIFFGGEITSTNDNGSSAVVVFDARSSGSFVSNRNVFLWRNYTNNLMVLSPTGNLGIGTVAPSEKLSVNGKIKAHEVNITTSGWADYVFKADYDLMPLNEVERYISERGHLPNIPSEREVIENGVNLLEMNIKLLEKVEELTLYVIELEKKIESKKF
ncbi:hypothetical protein [Algoriphagus pacificus]|uniref:Chaperone of endosialidase n=1 Tax=Algoriphagus pacificus TaxID=2811234 RepID=A0ABS3CP82_9BACT|nr:hypothetical protein [Algoriphagus pacificus]MBN7817464.1 hypothetical protein [Algoriphagus pacificus]